MEALLKELELALDQAKAESDVLNGRLKKTENVNKTDHQERPQISSTSSDVCVYCYDVANKI